MRIPRQISGVLQPVWHRYLSPSGLLAAFVTAKGLEQLHHVGAFLLIFSFGWIATLIPVWGHQVPTRWGWGALSGLSLAAVFWIGSYLTRRHFPIFVLVGCVVLISLATLFDFWRLPPVFILAQCRTYISNSLPVDVLHHVKAHWNWFPVTSGAMLLWIWVMPHANAPPIAQLPLRLGHLALCTRFVSFAREQVLMRLVCSLLMLICMGLAMCLLQSLAMMMQQAMSADGFVSAMVCGMALYHLLLNLFFCIATHRFEHAQPK
jgi:hypothetical protein